MKYLERYDRNVRLGPWRVWRAAGHIWLYLLAPMAMIGVCCYRDDDGEVVIALGLVLVRIELSFARSLTRAEREAVAAAHVVGLAEQFTKEAANDH